MDIFKNGDLPTLNGQPIKKRGSSQNNLWSQIFIHFIIFVRT